MHPSGRLPCRASLRKTDQLFELFLLAVPMATVAWVVTHEEVFREVQDWVHRKGEAARSVLGRKFFFLFTCEFSFSFYVALGATALTGFRLLYPSWLGVVVAWLALVWTANLYMSAYARPRLEIKKERTEIATQEIFAKELESNEISTEERRAGSVDRGRPERGFEIRYRG